MSKPTNNRESGQGPSEILSSLREYLVHQNPSLLIEKLSSSTSSRYGVDEKDPSVAIRIDPDGTETRGRWDPAGRFILLETSQ